MSKKAIVITHSPKPSKTLLAVIIIGLLWLGYCFATRTTDETHTDDQDAAQQAAVEKADRLATQRAAAENGIEQQAAEQQTPERSAAALKKVEKEVAQQTPEG